MKIKKESLWSLDYTFAAYILPRLQAFKNMPRTGYHGRNRKQWEERLTEMIFAFDYMLNEHDENFYKRWNVLDPYRKTADNHSIIKYYKLPNGMMQMTFDDTDNIEEGGILLASLSTDHYCDIEQIKILEKRSNKGLKLFGNYFRALWD